MKEGVHFNGSLTFYDHMDTSVVDKINIQNI